MDNSRFKEIWELNSEKYLDNNLGSLKEIESRIVNSALNVTGRERNEKIERTLNPPSLVGTFYYYIFVNKKVPTQEEYIAYYHNFNKGWIKNKVSEDLINAFDGRLSRTYPSVFRDLHFYFFLKQSGQFKRVIYKLKYDLEGKVDLFVLSKKGKWYGLQLRTNTKNSNYYAHNKKPYRNPLDIKGIEKIIDLPIKLHEAKSLSTTGDTLKVYGDNELKKLLNIIKDIEEI